MFASCEADSNLFFGCLLISYIKAHYRDSPTRKATMDVVVHPPNNI